MAATTGHATSLPATDCPAAFRPYSSETVLLDLMINPATREILERDLPELIGALPAPFKSGTVPTFTAIIDLRMMGNFSKQPPSVEALAKLDADLKTVPVTAAAAVARCARYDQAAPLLPRSIRRPSILVFSKINGFRDEPSVQAAMAALQAIGERHGWGLVFTENGAVHNPHDLKRFDAVVWNNVSGDVLTVAQRAALRAYVEHGGGFAAFHGSGGDPLYDWDWYADTLIGARFLNHPMAPQFQSAAVIVEDPHAGIVQGLPHSWTMTEEWYSFKASPRLRGAHILARLDESTYSPVNGSMDLHMGDHPIAWSHCVADGRSFYTAIGHRPENYREPHALRLLEQGIAWAANQGSSRCRQGKELPRG